MTIHDELAVHHPADLFAASKDVPALESLQSALYGATRFAESFLAAAGVVGAHLSRIICTPSARHWTLAFGEHFFEVEVLDDGFSVRSMRSGGLLRPSRRES